MLSLKPFLVQECGNVQRLLDETLRYAYDGSGSKEFYEECLARLRTIQEQIRTTGENQRKELNELAIELSNVSALITRIERSHIGEFSWPFATALKKLAILCSKDNHQPGKRYDPLFFFSADGGLYAYRIHPEQHRNSFYLHSIYNIVFPRSLKHSVLLHTILGHEIGHAAFSVASRKKELNDQVLLPLMEESPFRTVSDCVKWLKTYYGTNADPDLVSEALKSWWEEFLCDLFGLVLMGPSFIAAHQSLLGVLDADGQSFSLSHPPNLCRYWMILEATKHLGWRTSSPKASSTIKKSFKKFLSSIDSPTKNMPDEMRVFSKGQIAVATKALVKIVGNDGASYAPPDHIELSDLLHVLCRLTPPVPRKK